MPTPPCGRRPAALAEAKRVKAAAASGQLRALRQALDGVVRLAEQAADAARDVRDGWTFDEQAHFASGAFTKEVLAAAAEQGLDAFESDDRILSYPAIVAVSPSDATVVIDKRKDRRVRPSVLVRTLQALQDKPPKFKAEAFLEALAAAYDLVAAARGAQPGATVKLTDIYNVLTVLPGFGSRLQPPGAGPRSLPARSERRHDHQGRARAAAAGERAHPGLRRPAHGDPVRAGEGVRRHQLRGRRAVISVDDYAEFLATEYLDSYVADGGAAVKFVVAGATDDADRFSATVRDRAAGRGYVTVRVDAVDVRIHMMDQLFFAVAGQVDWDGLAAHRVRATYAAHRPSRARRRAATSRSRPWRRTTGSTPAN